MNTVIDEIYSKQIFRVNWNTQIDFNFLGNNFQFYYRFLEKFQRRSILIVAAAIFRGS